MAFSAASRASVWSTVNEPKALLPFKDKLGGELGAHSSGSSFSDYVAKRISRYIEIAEKPKSQLPL